MTAAAPNLQSLSSFCSSMFKHAAPEGFVSLRAFRDDGVNDKAIFIEPITVGDPAFIDVAFERVKQAASWHQPAVFCPPVMTFRTSKNAKTENILEGLVLTVECDCRPTEALTKLQSFLGVPTIVSGSGGEWQDPETGEIQRKLHLHWRLNQPTRSPTDHARLREARALATALVGGDASAVPLVHPLRWPGSLHRKATPRVAEILAESDAEIDLTEALVTLRDISGENPDSTAGSARKYQADNPQAVISALSVIPNKDLAWDEWNVVGMATWAATSGSDIGRKAFADWSAKSSKNDLEATEVRWQHYTTSPPSRIGFGTLVYLARKHSPGWGSGSATEAVDPVDLWGNFDPPSLPRGILPDLIERFAFDQGNTMGADMSGIAIGALAVCAAAIPDRIQLQVKKNDPSWRESARLWVALVGPVSAMKSPIMNAVTRPIRRIDSEMARAYQAEMSRFMKLSAEERKQGDQPKRTRLVIQDTTIEAVQEILRDSPDGVLLYNDELSGFFGSMDKYSGARGAAKDRAFYLEAYNGAPYSVSRVGRGEIYIEHLSVNILGGIQPEPIRKIADDSMDDGLLQRLLPITLRPAVFGQDEPPSGSASDYAKLVDDLHHIDNPMLGRIQTPTLIRFSEGAQAIRQELERKHLKIQQGVEVINRKLAGHVGKYNGIFARLCLTFHCIDSAGQLLPDLISEETAKRAKVFLHGFLLPHAISFYSGVLGLSNDQDRLAAVAGHILAHNLKKVTNRDVQRGDRTMRKLERREIESVLDQLDALGWLTRVSAPRPTDPPHWIVNPAVHSKFDKRAQAEAERRRHERSMITELMGRRAA